MRRPYPIKASLTPLIPPASTAKPNHAAGHANPRQTQARKTTTPSSWVERDRMASWAPQGLLEKRLQPFKYERNELPIQ
jgi:hypothetical protein